ncbi:hypothetical protein BDV97DRAFT_37695 [Delphinella strobiligena]|nr:hypothetical protein BDV97DRAFT_37695 [Delphinella strobiligena]
MSLARKSAPFQGFYDANSPAIMFSNSSCALVVTCKPRALKGISSEAKALKGGTRVLGKVVSVHANAGSQKVNLTYCTASLKLSDRQELEDKIIASRHLLHTHATGHTSRRCLTDFAPPCTCRPDLCCLSIKSRRPHARRPMALCHAQRIVGCTSSSVLRQRIVALSHATP